jgi:glycosyltransferase involved in cell wall biosynthesis
VSDPDLLALYRAADVNVVPSISFEGFGLVVLEAAACGTPSIVTRAGGLPEAIAGLGQDLTVPATDAGALAGRLSRAQQGQLPSPESTRGWAETHGWERVAQRHLELFERVRAPRGETSRRLRVVYLDHVAQLSGGELALLRLLTALTDVEAHVILAEEGPLVDRLLHAGISVEVLPMHGRTRELRKDSVRPGSLPLRAMADTLIYTLKLAWRLRQLRPDIVHSNSLKSGLCGSVAARLARRPLVWHLRDRIATDYLPWLGVLAIHILTRHLAHVVVCNSEATRQTLVPGTASLVIGSVADLTSPSRERTAAPEGSPLVAGMVGRLAPWKGQDVFLRAFSRAFPQGEERAVIVGAPLFGESEVAYGDELHRLAEKLDIGDRVEFRGHRDDVAAELAAVDVLVHASIVPEPFGQVVVEGMSAQLPVAASRAGGPEEIITDGVDGLLYPRGDVAALAEILVRLQADPQLRARLGRAAVRRARAFSPVAIAEQTMRAYELARAKPSVRGRARLIRRAQVRQASRYSNNPGKLK